VATNVDQRRGDAVDAPREIAFYVPESPVEFLWGQQLEAQLFRILTIPHLTHDVSLDDVVETAADPELHFVKLIRQSGHSTLRILVDAPEFLAPLAELGCTHVPLVMRDERFFALDVPPQTEITTVLDYITDGQDADHSDWELGSLSDVHGDQLRAVMDPENLPAWVPKA
jgi:hypothetical protein